MIPDRCDVPEEQKWNVEVMYETEDLWEKELQEVAQEKGWPELQKYRGRLGEKSRYLADALNLYFDIDRVLEKLYVYAHLRFDEDLGDDEHKKAYSRIQSLCHDFQMETSWIEPELLKMPEEEFQLVLSSEELMPYRIYLQRVGRMRAHTLSEEEEQLIALSGKSLSTAHKAFSAFNNADTRFQKAIDSAGNEHELSQGLYMYYLLSPDRALRKSAYENIHNAYIFHENTLAELLNGQMQNHVYLAKGKKYANCLEAALYPQNIDTSIYMNLIQTVRKNIKSLHKYISLRKKLMGVDELRAFDLYVPLVSEQEFHMEYENARALILDAFKPLGKDYTNALSKGLNSERWVDVYENQRKRSGAYSGGCYDSYPYILMNYNGTLKDVFTFAHEAGHSMHAYLSHTHQSFVNAQYPIFVAEVASTFNEQLLLKKLLENAKTKKERAYLINYAIEGLRGTLFRQTLFAEFELKMHEWAEKGVPLTPGFLREEYRKLNQEYYGPELILDEHIEMEWARIPHFYYNFYVYQYATGVSAAIALSEKAIQDQKKCDDYLVFLSSGGSKFPVELLQVAGVNMRSAAPIEAAIERFSEYVDELEMLLDEQENSLVYE